MAFHFSAIHISLAFVFALNSLSAYATDNSDPLYEAQKISKQKIKQIDSNLSIDDKVAYKIEIIHMNDVHSFIDPLGVTVDTPNGYVRIKTGGSETTNAFIKKRREINPNLLVISAGDQIMGNAANYDIFHGKTDAALHALYETDFYVYGNHEFDLGGKVLAEFVNYMRELSPNSILLNSDLSVGSNSPLKKINGTPSYIKEVNGKPIAFYGITTSNKILESSNPDPDMKFVDGPSIVNELTKNNASKTDIHVVVSHRGLLDDLESIKKLNDIDIIIGGDSHSLCGPFTKYGLLEECEYPITAINANGKKTCIVHANEYGKVIGDLHVSFDKNGDVITCGGHAYMNLWPETAYFTNKVQEQSDKNNIQAKNAIYAIIKEKDSPFLLAQSNEEARLALDSYRKQIYENTKIIGNLEENLCTTRYPTDTCPIKNVTSIRGSESCQVFGKMFVESIGTPKTIFIANSGMFRIDLEKGAFSNNNLLEILPFHNSLYKVNMLGKDFVAMLNNAVTYVNGDITGRDGGIPCGYGFSFSMTNAKSNPISDIKVHDWNDNYNLINPNQMYEVIVTTYLLKGKDGYDIMANYSPLDDGKQIYDVVTEYLKQKKIFPLIPEHPTITKFKTIKQEK